MNNLSNNPVLRRVTFLICFFITGSAVAQQQYNLVPNYSFENYAVCPSKLNSYPPYPWYNACKHIGSYCNSCCNDNFAGVPINYVGNFGYQNAHSGYGYAIADFLYSGERTYIQVNLNTSLIANKKYYAAYYVNIPNPLKLACNNVAMLFTDTAIYSDLNRLTFNPIIANPQIVNYGNPIIVDTLNWIKVSGIFKANGGEQYLTIGNFKDDNQTLSKVILPSSPYAKASYYIDDVSVIPLDSMPLKTNAGRDTTIHIGDSVFIGSYTNGIDTIKWLQNGIIPIDSTRPGFWVKPLVNTCYVLTQTVNGYTSSDTVCVNVQPLPLKFIQFTAAPTPPKVGLIEAKMDWETVNEINVSHFNIQRSINGRDFITIGTVKANSKENNKYNYIDGIRNWELGISKVYYRIEAVDFDGRKQYSGIRNVELGIRNGVSIYPNPAKDVVHVMGKDIKEVRLINYLGQLVHKEIVLYLAMTSDTQLLTINCKLLTKGLYMVQVILTNGTITNEKLVIE